jgi:regulator of RNase E activity RraA
MRGKMGDLNEQEFAALRALDTPTVCNAIEIVDPNRRLAGFTTAPLVCARPNLPPMVGYAVTATVRATKTSPEAGATRATYLEHLAASSRPTIAIIHDIDPEPGFGAFWGEVNTAVHSALGCIGTVTNGSIRDLDECAEGFQLLAGQIGPSHGYIHVVESNIEVIVAGMTVNPGDVIHADKHGAVVIPANTALAVAEAADLITRREAVVLSAARAPEATLGKIKQAMAESAKIN